MLFKILLTYTIVSQLIVLPWLWWSLKECEVQDQLGSLDSISEMRKCVAWTIGALLALIAAPFILPWMLYSAAQCYFETERERQKLFQLYMEISLEPLHEANIADELLEHVESFTPAAMSQGFELLGDFYLKGEPYNSKARILLDADRIMFVEFGRTSDTNYIEVTSFLENGDYVSTASVAEFPKAASFARHGVYVNCGGAMDLNQLIQIHLESLDPLVAETGQPIRIIELSRWRDYYLYHNQKFGHARFEMRELLQPPEKCEFPSPLNTANPSPSQGDTLAR